MANGTPYSNYQGYLATKQQTQKGTLKKRLKTQLTQEEAGMFLLESSRQTLTNPYANLRVATQATDIQREETDLALANALDTLAQAGTGASGATALAQAAARSKAGISADIQKQELNNQQLAAQGEMTMLQMQEQRELTQLDRQQAKIDNLMAAEVARKEQNMQLIGSIVGAVGTVAGGALSNEKLFS